MRGAEAAGAPDSDRDAEQPRLPGPGTRPRGEPGGGGPQEPRKQWKKFLYCEPHRRVKEVLEEELYIKRDECHIKSPPAAAALDGIWSIQRNLPVGGSRPGHHGRGGALPPAKAYSRHGGLRVAPGPRNCSGNQLPPARRAPPRPGNTTLLLGTEEKEEEAPALGDRHKDKIRPFSIETKPFSLRSEKQRRNSDLLCSLRGVKNVY